MALQTSGAISLNDMHIEVGGSSGSQVSINDSDIRVLIGKSSGAQNSFSEYYGASNSFAFTISSNTVHANLSSLATAAGWDGSSALDVTVNSGVWLYATSTSNYGLTINVANTTLRNYGKIIGMGGVGSSSAQGNGSAGGAALRVTQSGCSIINYSGAYIAGGGGGGGGSDFWGGGGGGAGGANGGSNIYGKGGGSGGGLNSSGSNGATETTTNDGGEGGQAGGSGSDFGGGGGGGRILPGTRRTAISVSGYGGYVGTPGYGGAGGEAGGNGTTSSTGAWRGAAGGGGGWGSAGGGAPVSSGGSAGAAISRTTSISLSNSGTIYGST